MSKVHKTCCSETVVRTSITNTDCEALGRSIITSHYMSVHEQCYNVTAL